MVHGSEFKKQVNDAKEYGWKVESLKHDWDVLNTSIEKELDRLAGIYINILKNSGCKIITGKAHFINPSEILLQR